MNTITRESFSEAMKKAVAERGEDYVYGRSEEGLWGCWYTLDGVTGDCLIGKALEILGVDMELLRDNQQAVGPVLSSLGVTDGKLMGAARLAQMEQDLGETWGESYRVFENTLREDWIR